VIVRAEQDGADVVVRVLDSGPGLDDIDVVIKCDGLLDFDSEYNRAIEVALVPGFTWKATLAVLTSLVLLVIASYSGAFWYVLALSGLGTAAAVIVAFILELRGDRVRTSV